MNVIAIELTVLMFIKKCNNFILKIFEIFFKMKPSERLKQQKKYVQYAESGEKSIIVRWKENVLKIVLILN